MNNGIKYQIRQYVVENLLFSGNGHDLNDDQSFLDTGIIDSLGVMELAAFVEDEFGINVSDEEIIPQNFDTINYLAKYVESKNGTRA
jgi:acyl carrier protein